MEGWLGFCFFPTCPSAVGHELCSSLDITAWKRDRLKSACILRLSREIVLGEGAEGSS